MQSTDLREQALMDATRRLMEGSNYDPHFAHVGEREIMETKLFLARMDALTTYYQQLAGFKIGSDGVLIPIFDAQRRLSETFPLRTIPVTPDPVPMILWCPSCGEQHVDAADDHKPDCKLLAVLPRQPELCDCDRWTNPPHTSHLCARCNHIWRPADVPTAGVAEIATVGKNDRTNPVRGQISAARIGRPKPRWRHTARQITYNEVGVAELQTRHANGRDPEWAEGFSLMIYRGSDGKLWARAEKEFDGDRFVLIGVPKV